MTFRPGRWTYVTAGGGLVLLASLFPLERGTAATGTEPASEVSSFHGKFFLRAGTETAAGKPRPTVLPPTGGAKSTLRDRFLLRQPTDAKMASIEQEAASALAKCATASRKQSQTELRDPDAGPADIASTNETVTGATQQKTRDLVRDLQMSPEFPEDPAVTSVPVRRSEIEVIVADDEPVAFLEPSAEENDSARRPLNLPPAPEDNRSKDTTDSQKDDPNQLDRAMSGIRVIKSWSKPLPPSKPSTSSIRPVTHFYDPSSPLRHSRYTYDIRFRPLYFEQALKERCGVGAGCLSTAASATAFVGQAILLPYQAVVLCPSTLVSPLGDCQTGSSYPLGVTIPRPWDCREDELLPEIP